MLRAVFPTSVRRGLLQTPGVWLAGGGGRVLYSTTVAPKPRRIFVKIVAGSLFVLSSGVLGTVAYAKYDPSFRKSVEDNVPYTTDVFQHFIDNDITAHLPSRDDILVPLSNLKDKIMKFDLWHRKDVNMELPPLIRLKKPQVSSVSKDDDKTTERETKSSESKEAVPVERPTTKKTHLTKEQVDDTIRQQEIEEAVESAAIESMLESAVSKCNSAVEMALSKQKQAVEGVRNSIDKLKTAMDDNTSTGSGKDQQWQELSDAKQQESITMNAASKAAETARQEMDTLNIIVKEGKERKLNAATLTAVITAEQKMNKMLYDLDKSSSDVSTVVSDSNVLAQYKSLIEQGREQFKKEVESILPDVKLGKRGRKLSEDELNSLIAHAHRRIDQLQRQLAEQHANEQKSVESALNIQHVEGEKLSKSKLDLELANQKRLFGLEVDKNVMDERARFELELRHQLSRQAAAHSDHLSDVLHVQQNELEKKHNQQLQEEVVKSQLDYRRQLNIAMGKLKGIEKAIEDRADIEKQTRQAQELWLACEMLKKTLQHGKEDSTSEGLVQIQDEISTICHTAPRSELLATVLSAIPPQVLDKGVYCEDDMRDRFRRVRRIARRVSMVDETNNSLFTYLLSYVQSLLTFDRMFSAEIPEAINPTADTDVFKLLSYANRALQEGQLDLAVRFVNQLRGEPRRVAADWLSDAIILLELKQTATLLSAYCKSTAVGSLPVAKQ